MKRLAKSRLDRWIMDIAFLKSFKEIVEVILDQETGMLTHVDHNLNALVLIKSADADPNKVQAWTLQAPDRCQVFKHFQGSKFSQFPNITQSMAPSPYPRLAQLLTCSRSSYLF